MGFSTSRPRILKGANFSGLWREKLSRETLHFREFPFLPILGVRSPHFTHMFFTRGWVPSHPFFRRFRASGNWSFPRVPSGRTNFCTGCGLGATHFYTLGGKSRHTVRSFHTAGLSLYFSPRGGAHTCLLSIYRSVYERPNT